LKCIKPKLVSKVPAHKIGTGFVTAMGDVDVGFDGPLGRAGSGANACSLLSHSKGTQEAATASSLRD
jgi:hypothetical protein